MASPAAEPSAAATGTAEATGIVARVRAHLGDPLYGAGYYLLANKLTLAGSGLVFWLIVARLLPPSEVGPASVAASTLLLLAAFAKLGMDVHILGTLPRATPPRAAALLDTAFTLSTSAAVLAALVYAWGTPLWTPSLRILHDEPLAALAFAALAGVASYGFLIEDAFTARGRADLALWKNAVHGVARVALVVALALYLDASIVVVAGVATVTLGVLVVLPAWRRVEASHVPRPGWSWPVIREAWSNAFSNYGVSLMIAAPTSVGAIIVLERFGPEEAAVFYVLWMFGSIASMAPSALGQSSLVRLSGAKGANEHRWRRTAGMVVVTWAILGLGSLAFPLFGERYSTIGAVSLVPFMLSVIPAMVFHTRMARLRVARRPGQLLAGAGATLASFALGLLLAPWGALASGWIWLAAISIGALVYCIPERKV